MSGRSGRTYALHCARSPSSLTSGARYASCSGRRLYLATHVDAGAFHLPRMDGAICNWRSSPGSKCLVAAASTAPSDSGDARNTENEASGWISCVLERWKRCVGARGGCGLLLKLAVGCALAAAVLAICWATAAASAPQTSATVASRATKLTSLTAGAPEQQWCMWRWLSYKVQTVSYTHLTLPTILLV